MTDRIDIAIGSTFDPRGATAAKQAVDQLRQSGAAYGTAAAGAAKAAAEAAKLAAANSRAATAAAQTATAEQRKAVATATAAAATSRAAKASSDAAAADSRASREAANAAAAQDRATIAALRRAQAEERVAVATARTASGQQSWSAAMRQAAGNVDQLVGTVTKLGSGLAVIEAGKAIYSIAQIGASAKAAEQSFGSLAAAAGQSGDQLLAALTKASGGAVAQADIIRSANTALLLLGSDAATKLPRLLEIAKASATTLGTDVGMVFNSLVTGISRNSTELIDNAGITVKAGEAYATYAAQIGKSADSLSSAERQQAILNAVLVGGEDILTRTAGAGETAATTMQRLAASGSNVAVTLGAALANGIQPLVGGLANLLNAVDSGIQQLQQLDDKLAATGERFLAESETYEEYRAKVDELNSALPPLVQGLEPVGESAFNAAKGLEASGASAGDAASQIAGLDASVAGGVTTMDLFSSALGRASKEGPAAAASVQSFGAELLTTASSSDAARAATDTLLSSYELGIGTTEGMASASAVLTANQGYLSEANAATSAAINQYAAAVLTGQVSAEEFEAAIIALVTGQQMQASASDDSTAATEANTGATDDSTAAAFENLSARLEQEAAARVAEQAEYDLDAALRTAAAGGANAAGVVSMLVSRYGIEASEVYRLIGLYQQLNAARGRGAASALSQVGARGHRGPGTTAAAEVRQEAVQNARGGRAGGGGGGSGGRAGGSGGRAGGADPAAKAAEKQVKASEQAAAKLVEIQQQAAEKIQEINAAAAEKLVAIDRKAAEERARIAQDLANEIGRTMNDAAVEAETNDLDAIGETDKKALQAIEAREQAEADAQQRRADAAAEAQKQIAAGNAESAQAEYEQQKAYIDDRQSLDEAYNNKKAELANNPEAQAALEKEYQEAITALERRRDDEIAIQQQTIAAKQQQRDEEKAKVIADAEEQKAKVVASAVEQAEKVKGASAGTKEAVIADLQAQGGAVTDWAAATEAAAARVAAAYQKAADAAANLPAPPAGGDSSGSGSGTGQSAAAGGGTFMTSGPTTLTVGDNPGGVELVSVVPISGKGTTRVGGGMAQMAGGGSILAGLPSGDQVRRALQSLTGAGIDEGTAEAVQRATEAVAGLISLVTDIQALARVEIGQPIPIDAIQAALAQGRTALELLRAELVPLSEQQAQEIEHYLGAVGGIFDLISQANDIVGQMADLARALEAPPPPIDLAVLQQLAQESAQVASVLSDVIVPGAHVSIAALEDYAAAVSGAADILLATADLARETASIPPPINVRGLERLADESAQIQRIVAARLVRPAEADLEMLRRYAEAVAQSVGIIRGLADLARQLAAPAAPINEAYVAELARQSLRVGGIVGGVLVPITDANMERLRDFSEAVERSIAVIRGVSELRQTLGAPAPPLNTAYVTALAQEAQAVALIVSRQVFAFSKAMLEDIEDYAGVVGRAVDILRTTAGLRGDVANLEPPLTIAAIQQLAAEARAVALIISRELFVFSKASQDDLLQYAEVVSATTSILRDVASLRGELAGSGGPIAVETIRALATEARAIALIVSGPGMLVDLSQDAADGLSRYAGVVGSSVAILRDVAGLRGELTTVGGVISETTIRALATEAKRITEIVRGQLLPTTEQQTDAMGLYADAAGASTAIVRDVASLRGEAAQLGAPIPEATIRQLAAEAKRITEIVRGLLVPTTEQQTDAAQRYADAAGAGVGILRDVLSLGGDLFTDYRSPTDAQLQLVARDALRLVNAFKAGAAVLGTEGAEQARAYGDALGSMFTATREGLLAFQAINDQTFELNPQKLAQFERSTQQTIATIGRLGQEAARIPAANIAALQATSGAISAQAEALIKLAAVPMNNLGGNAAGIASGGVGASAITITFTPGSIVITGGPHVNTQQLANLATQQVIAALNQRYQGYR